MVDTEYEASCVYCAKVCQRNEMYETTGGGATCAECNNNGSDEMCVECNNNGSDE